MLLTLPAGAAQLCEREMAQAMALEAGSFMLPAAMEHYCGKWGLLGVATLVLKRVPVHTTDTTFTLAAQNYKRQAPPPGEPSFYYLHAVFSPGPGSPIAVPFVIGFTGEPGRPGRLWVEDGSEDGRRIPSDYMLCPDHRRREIAPLEKRLGTRTGHFTKRCVDRFFQNCAARLGIPAQTAEPLEALPEAERRTVARLRQTLEARDLEVARLRQTLEARDLEVERLEVERLEALRLEALRANSPTPKRKASKCGDCKYCKNPAHRQSCVNTSVKRRKIEEENVAEAARPEEAARPKAARQKFVCPDAERLEAERPEEAEPEEAERPEEAEPEEAERPEGAERLFEEGGLGAVVSTDAWPLVDLDYHYAQEEAITETVVGMVKGGNWSGGAPPTPGCYVGIDGDRLDPDTAEILEDGLREMVAGLFGRNFPGAVPHWVDREDE
jgi:hypothetical protein